MRSSTRPASSSWWTRAYRGEVIACTVHGAVAVDEQLMLLATLPLQPVIDRVGRDRRGQRAEVVRRRAGDGRRAARSSSASERRVRPDVSRSASVVGSTASVLKSHGLDGALFGAEAPCASRIVERVDAGVPFIGWARGPFPVSRVRGDSRHTYPVHVVLLSACPEGDEVEAAPRRATWRGGQDGHSEDDLRIDLRLQSVKSGEIVCVSVRERDSMACGAVLNASRYRVEVLPVGSIGQRVASATHQLGMGECERVRPARSASHRTPLGAGSNLALEVLGDKQITVWGDSRNKADHAKLHEITLTELSALISGTRAFIDKHFRDQRCHGARVE